MKKRLFVALFSMTFAQFAIAQTIKTGVLVIGNGSNAVGAAFQSALSGVKTTMLIQAEDLNIAPSEKDIPSGLAYELIKKLRLARGIKDSTARVYVDRTSANEVLNTWADSIKNLTVIRSLKWSRIKRSGNNWTVLLANGRTVKAEVLVDADGSGFVKKALLPARPLNKLWQPLQYQDKLYRISVSSGYAVDNRTGNIIPLCNFLKPAEENLVILDPDQESMMAGQAAGAIAAYAVFFKTKTSLSALKPIQKELIGFKLALMPFADIRPEDPNWKPIQFVGLSGFLKAVFVNGNAHFLPEQAVSTAEIKEPMKEFYYKAQIWFDDYKEPQMTVGSLLQLITMVGNKGMVHTKAAVQKNWDTRYQFKNPFDLNRAVTRREFAVLVDEYLNPFNINIDKTGRVVR